MEYNFHLSHYIEIRNPYLVTCEYPTICFSLSFTHQVLFLYFHWENRHLCFEDTLVVWRVVVKRLQLLRYWTVGLSVAVPGCGVF
ncbi:hypothetical protein CR513_37372, partial [Mucuna pruriens]